MMLILSFMKSRNSRRYVARNVAERCETFWSRLFFYDSDVKTGVRGDWRLMISIALQAKEREHELRNQWASNRSAQRQSANKYGF